MFQLTPATPVLLLTHSEYYDYTVNHCSTCFVISPMILTYARYMIQFGDMQMIIWRKKLLQLDLLDICMIECTILETYWDPVGHARILGIYWLELL